MQVQKERGNSYSRILVEGFPESPFRDTPPLLLQKMSNSKSWYNRFTANKL